MPEDGLAFSIRIVVEALVLPTILFEVCQQVKIWFLFEYIVLVFDSFLEDRRNEPAFTGW